ncbi:RNA polymerase II transcription regulator recruiting protein [Aureococcus anophagefferens]|nr:RNA polymerase II transcription regulator recruiting protein [Aureococcus anophagefferens]
MAASNVAFARSMARFVLLLSLSIDAFHLPSPRTAAIRPLQQHSQHRNTQRSPRRNPFALRSTLADTVISAGVSIDTFLPQFFWLPMIAFPRAELTKRVNGNLLPVLACSLVHAVVVLLAATDDFPRGIEPIFIFADVFDPTQSQLDAMRRLFEVPNFVAEEWPHVLIWDLFVGRLIWLDGVNRNIVCWHSLLLTNFIGPPGLLLHAATSALSRARAPTPGRRRDAS